MMLTTTRESTRDHIEHLERRAESFDADRLRHVKNAEQAAEEAAELRRLADEYREMIGDDPVYVVEEEPESDAQIARATLRTIAENPTCYGPSASIHAASVLLDHDVRGNDGFGV